MYRATALRITIPISFCWLTILQVAAADIDQVAATMAKRTALWQALEKALPKKHEDIDVYCENPSLTAVLFRSNHTTCIFSVDSAKVEEVMHRKAIFHINRITFDTDEKFSHWRLWYNGRLELSVMGKE